MIGTLVDAAIVTDEGDTTPINGIPAFHSGNKGKFHGKYPSMAASKALTSIYKHLLKYREEWFPWYEPLEPPRIILVMENTKTGKKYAYLGSRETAPQSLYEPRVIIGPQGRQREYRWKNKLARMALANVGY